ncbi:MAG: hypothetical protein Terrestrivirus2_133 [Terrestrivirus sp.]|uniref:Uncharacterized protein n=1 Tax=Terrestrivirus sp. TaxID=2487775 RepID=A0A3G4ZLB3_9VIRU|nr:MAG: hypothetical protein Terrestrivirus2_133 [Terrestrivirus sp.]
MSYKQINHNNFPLPVPVPVPVTSSSRRREFITKPTVLIPPKPTQDNYMSDTNINISANHNRNYDANPNINTNSNSSNKTRSRIDIDTLFDADDDFVPRQSRGTSSRLINPHKITLENMVESNKIKHAHTANINSFNTYPITEKNPTSGKESTTHVTIDNNTAAIIDALGKIERKLDELLKKDIKL